MKGQKEGKQTCNSQRGYVQKNKVGKASEIDWSEIIPLKECLMEAAVLRKTDTCMLE